MSQKVSLRQSTIPFIFLVLFYCTFYGTLIALLYAALTFNITMIVIFSIIGLLQIPIGRTRLFT